MYSLYYLQNIFSLENIIVFNTQNTLQSHKFVTLRSIIEEAYIYGNYNSASISHMQDKCLKLQCSLYSNFKHFYILLYFMKKYKILIKYSKKKQKK